MGTKPQLVHARKNSLLEDESSVDDHGICRRAAQAKKKMILQVLDPERRGRSVIQYQEIRPRARLDLPHRRTEELRCQ